MPIGFARSISNVLSLQHPDPTSCATLSLGNWTTHYLHLIPRIAVTYRRRFNFVHCNYGGHWLCSSGVGQGGEGSLLVLSYKIACSFFKVPWQCREVTVISVKPSNPVRDASVNHDAPKRRLSGILKCLCALSPLCHA